MFGSELCWVTSLKECSEQLARSRKEEESWSDTPPSKYMLCKHQDPGNITDRNR